MFLFVSRLKRASCSKHFSGCIFLRLADHRRMTKETASSVCCNAIEPNKETWRTWAVHCSDAFWAVTYSDTFNFTTLDCFLGDKTSREFQAQKDPNCWTCTKEGVSPKVPHSFVMIWHGQNLDQKNIKKKPNHLTPTTCLTTHKHPSFLLRCQGRHDVVVQQAVVQAWQDLWFTPPPMDAIQLLAINQVRTKVTKVNPPRNVPPPMMHPPPLTCHPSPPCVVHGDGGSEVPWPLGLNLVCFFLFLSFSLRQRQKPFCNLI